MIISHKHKFIFLKAKKSAGTSIEVNLAKYCDEKDIITFISKYSEEMDEDFYTHPFKLYKYYYDHMSPREIKKEIGKKLWDSYFKFTVIRNPWDLSVSLYYWMKYWVKAKGPLKKSLSFYKKRTVENLTNPKAYIEMLRKIRLKFGGHAVKNDFDLFIMNFPLELASTKYYLSFSGKPVADFYIRYENLEDDYKKVCGKLGIPYERLYRLKTKLRKGEGHYSSYYNSRTRDIVSRRFRKEIERFNYKFEGK